MDESPQLPSREDLETVEATNPDLPVAEVSNIEVVELPPLVEPISVGSLWRDAIADLFAALATGACVILVAGVTLMLVRGSDYLTQSFRSTWGIILLLLATQLPLLFFALRRRHKNREKGRVVLDLFGGNAAPAILRGIAAGFAMAVLSAVYTLLVQRVIGEGSVENQLEFLKDMLNDRVGIGVIVMIVAGLGPMCEEIFFRGAIFGSARAAGHSRAGVVISAVLFACAHLSLTLFPFYAAFGVTMCWLYARTRTLAAPMAAHMTMNALACVALLMAGDQTV